MALVLINSDTLQRIAEAIKSKLGNDKKMLPSEMPKAIDEISTGKGEGIDLATLADGTYPWSDYIGTETAINTRLYSMQSMSSYTNNSLISIGVDNAFTMSTMQRFSAPNLETLNNKSNIFQYCNYLIEVDIGKVTALPTGTFYGSPKLAAVPNADIITSVGQQCFSFNSTLTEIDLKQCESIGPFAFAQCGNLEVVRLPSIVNLTANIFNNSHKIQIVELGEFCKSVTNSAFSSCKIDLTLIVRATTPPTLNGSFMLGSGGAVISVMVPAESVEAYKNAPNWSNYALVISAISN